jgi:hypothetical protein
METPATTSISLSLREIAQLFNSMDPSPFLDRDLDADAEEFITSWARELSPGRELVLVIKLAFDSPGACSTEVEDAVRRYFATRAAMKQLEFGQLLRRGRLSLGVGIVFLVLCLFLAEFVAKSRFGAATDIIKEGLTIAGWVAMWRPLEIYLYDWWPLYDQRRQLERLARIRVRLVLPEANSGLEPDSGKPLGEAIAATAA